MNENEHANETPLLTVSDSSETLTFVLQPEPVAGKPVSGRNPSSYGKRGGRKKSKPAEIKSFSAENINDFIDFTLLKQSSDYLTLNSHCRRAIEKNYFAVCVPPFFAEKAVEMLKGSSVKLCSVVGFPTGSALTSTKIQEADALIRVGVQEIDMVMNLHAFKSDDLAVIRNEFRRIKILTQSKAVTLKIILETGLLNEEELRIAAGLCIEFKVDFVKTSTGFVNPGAELDKVKLLREILPEKIKIKASGGIRTLEQALAFLNAGAERIGTSSEL